MKVDIILLFIWAMDINDLYSTEGNTDVRSHKI